MRIILNNQFAPMPVCGHNYAAAQFIGRGPTEFSMQLASIGDNKLGNIQAMHEELEENARSFRKFEGAARVRFHDNQFLRLAGIRDGIITSIDTETDSAGTNLYRCQMSFTSDGHHMESFNQEMYVESDIVGDVVEGLLSRVNVTVLSRTATRALESDYALATSVRIDTQNVGRQIGRFVFGGWSETVGGIGESFGETVGETTGTILGTAWGWTAVFARQRLRRRHSGGVGGSGVASNVTSIDGLLEGARQELDVGLHRWFDYVTRGGSEFESQQEQRGAYLLFPVETDVPDAQDQAAIYSVIEDREHAWVNQYTERIREIFQEWMSNLPGHTFFRGSRRGQYRTYEMQGPVSENPEEGVRTQYEPREGTITRWPPMLGDESSVLSGMVYGRRRRWRSLRNNRITGRNSIEGNLFEFEQLLMSVAQTVLGEAQGNEDFNDVFPGIQERWLNSPRMSANPTYPDLELPPHPVSNLVIDTEPDFYFFNDGEEGLLNDIGPDLVTEIDERLNNMELSYARLASGTEWRETYLGRNRIGISNHDEGAELGLSDTRRDALFDASPKTKIDNSTNEGASEFTGQAGWGRPEGGRVIGGGTAAMTDSIVEQVLGMSATVHSTQGSTGVNDVLTQRRISMMRNTSFPLPEGGTERTISVGPVDTGVGGEDRSHSFSRQALRTIVQQSVAQAPEETLTMRRAFPSFKIYFVEDDIGARHDNSRRISPTGGGFGSVRPMMFFDDLYNYNSVKAIRLIRTRKNPADLLVLTLTNIQGLLERRQWSAPGERDREIYAPGFEDTELENPLKKIIMKEGLKVQARLGYSNNPDKMGNKFVGEVVEVSYNAAVSDEVTIICQSYGAELVLEKKGIAPGARTSFIDTPDLIHTLMCSPELVHFGRWDLNPQFNPAEARSAATSRRDPSTGTEQRTGSGRLPLNPTAAIQAIQELLVINRSKWLLANDASDDNVFAPGIRDHLTEWERFTDDVGAQLMWGADWIEAAANTLGGIEFLPLHIATLGGSYIASHLWGLIASGVRAVGNWMNDGGFQLSGQTIWETLKECELRHPGWIAHPRPYGTRNTLFFGVPSHRYWADQQSREEMVILRRMEQAMGDQLRRNPNDVLMMSQRYAAESFSGLGTGEVNRAGNAASSAITQLASLNGRTRAIWIRTCFQMATNQWLADAGEYLGSTLGRFRPFRRYHLITSDHHILMNNIRASKRGTFNAVTLQYGNGNVYTLKADDSIPDELTRVQGFNYPSCDNETLARRYCIGLLVRHLKDVYKGEIVVTGMDVDPYDQCYLHDDRLGMYGGFEIEQVVDTFTAETGWITEITPDLIAGTNNWSTQSTAEARNAVLGTIAHRYIGSRFSTTQIAAGTIAATGAPGVIGAAVGAPGVGMATAAAIGVGGVLAWMGSYHIIRWSQDRQPLWVIPLILGERPFFAGLDGFRQDGIFASVRGELHAQFDAVQEGWRQFHLAGWANDMVVGFFRAAGGQGVRN